MTILYALTKDQFATLIEQAEYDDNDDLKDLVKNITLHSVIMSDDIDDKELTALNHVLSYLRNFTSAPKETKDAILASDDIYHKIKNLKIYDKVYLGKSQKDKMW